MAKKSYTVPVMRKGREQDYRDFWDRKIYVNSAGEKLHSELVGFTESVIANNLEEAISVVQKKYPALTIAKDHSS